ncbi:MAG: class II aldolase/adducin family protein [bacterium]
MSIADSREAERAGAAREIVLVCHRLYAAGLIAGQDGNVSIRLPSGHVLVTPAGMSKCDVTMGDLVEVTASGVTVAGTQRPSSELDMHLRIYARRVDVRAVVHAHPPVATGFGVAGLDFMDDVLPETIFQLGGVPLVPYALPGSPALGDAMEPFLAHHDGFLLANHGATTVGHTLEVAHQRMESLEHGARILRTARMLGRVNVLGAREGEAVRTVRRAALAARHPMTPETIDEQE